MLRALLIAAALLGNGAALAAAPRIVSLSVCADQFVLALARHEQILSLSPDAANPRLSILWREAAGIPRNRGMAEEAFALKPDIVVSNYWGRRQGADLLERFGIRVERLPLPVTFEEVRLLTRTVALALDAVPRGEILIAEMDAILDKVRRDRAERGPVRAAYYKPGGGSTGGGTFVDSVFAAAGLDNALAGNGPSGWGRKLPLEELIMNQPELLVLSFFSDEAMSLAQRMRHHDALDRLLAHVPVETVPGEMWVCGGWFLALAVERLNAAAARVAGP
jgi:iron complex transport system substrate-binding protein